MQADRSDVHASFLSRLFGWESAEAPVAPACAKAQAPSPARRNAAAGPGPTAPPQVPLRRAPAPHRTAPAPYPDTGHEARHGVSAIARAHQGAPSSTPLAAPTGPTP